MVYDVVVVGAGPAGLFAGIGAAHAGARVLVLECSRSPGRKLLISGSGQCNLTHDGPIAAFIDRYGEHGRFLRSALFAFDNEAVRTFFARSGLPLETTEGGKVFPVSRRAADVLAILLKTLRAAGVELQPRSRVSSIGPCAEGFAVAVDDSRTLTRSVVLATGGRSYPRTGSSGDGYALAASLGHRIIEPAPALTPIRVRIGPDRDSLEPDFKPFLDCAGIAVRDATITVVRDGRKAASGRGDLLFTHEGLSGPGILDLSRSIEAGDTLRVSLGDGGRSFEEVEGSLLAELGEHGGRGIVRSLQALGVPERLARALLAANRIDQRIVGAVLSREQRRVLVAAIAGGGDAGFPVIVDRLGSWDEAMATRGGVDLAEVDPKRMESRLVPGLFFAGEVLDIDGDTGGFNIQAAISTGMLAGGRAGLSAAAAQGK